MEAFMKIAIIGATGRVGSLVAEEALKRGHEVTGIVIDPENIKNDRIQVVEKSIFDLRKQDLEGFDAVVSAFGQFNPGLVFQHQTAMMSLINAMKDLPEVRLLVVGGAASLFTDDTMEHRVLESIPENFRGVPSNMFEAFKNLQNSTVNWTYFSPAYTFDPKGTRTGSYKLGTDVVFNNDEGESYISYADYAIAMVDEIENKQFVGRRFTAVSNKNGAPAEDKPAENAPKEFPDVQFKGNSKYRPPLVTELAGKSFHLCMDNGDEGTLFFLNGENVMWAPLGAPSRTDPYECAKVDEDTYFVNIEMADYKPRTCITLILDLEQNLVTALFAPQGKNKKFPILVDNEFVFGAIKVDGQDLPEIRHGFTSDLVGTRIRWRYTDTFAITHCYFDANYLRAPGPKADDHSERAEKARKRPYDVKCRYVKIKENVYFISFIEDFSTRKDPFVGCNLAFCCDISRLHDVGRSYGTWGGVDENYIFTAVGEWVDAEEEDFAQSRYRV